MEKEQTCLNILDKDNVPLTPVGELGSLPMANKDLDVSLPTCVFDAIVDVEVTLLVRVGRVGLLRVKDSKDFENELTHGV